MGALDGRVCVITGAGRGIGRAHALLFAKEGARVVVNDLGGDTGGSGADPGPARAVADEIVAAGGRAVASTHSVADWDGARQIIDTAVTTFGDLHVVVNNAAVLRGWPLVSMTEDDFDTVVGVNLKGTFNVTRWAAAYWRERADSGAGSARERAIVNTSSGAGLHGTSGQANYAAAKAGIAAMTLVNAVELAPLGVRVNCVAPVARTRLARAVPGGAGDLLDRPVFDPRHISPVVAALSTAGCPFTGQVFSVVGGSVGIYAGWSIAQEVTNDDGWSVEGLREAMASLPRDVAVNSQRERLAAAMR